MHNANLVFYLYLSRHEYTAYIFFSISIGHRDAIQAVDDPNYNRNSRLNNWVDINEEDMKLFMAHVIVMGLIRKPNVTKYWVTKSNNKYTFLWKVHGMIEF